MKITRFALIGAAFAGVLGSAALAEDTMAPTSVTVKMVALNHSGENGMATVTQLNDGGIAVAVRLDNAPADVPQPTHIHIGTCGNINKAPEYALRNTVNGKSDSTVPGVSLAELLKGKYAINVHKSGTELGTYVSCGNIRVR